MNIKDSFDILNGGKDINNNSSPGNNKCDATSDIRERLDQLIKIGRASCRERVSVLV